MTHRPTRRDFLTGSAQAAACLALTVTAGATARAQEKKPLFDISLAQWSLHRALFSGKLDNLDFAKVAKQEYGISAIEYVNQFFKDKARDQTYLSEMKKRAHDLGVESRLIMCDGE